MMLFQFGFTDYIVNKYLLTTYKDANIVADMLLNGQVTEQEIKKIYA